MGHGLSSFSARAIWVRDAFEGYFSVHNWTRMPICLRSLCSWRTLRVGSGVSKCCSAFRFVLPAGFPVFLGFGSCPRLAHPFRAALSEYSSAGRSALRPFYGGDSHAPKLNRISSGSIWNRRCRGSEVWIGEHSLCNQWSTYQPWHSLL